MMPLLFLTMLTLAKGDFVSYTRSKSNSWFAGWKKMGFVQSCPQDSQGSITFELQGTNDTCTIDTSKCKPAGLYPISRWDCPITETSCTENAQNYDVVSFNQNPATSCSEKFGVLMQYLNSFVGVRKFFIKRKFLIMISEGVEMGAKPYNWKQIFINRWFQEASVTQFKLKSGYNVFGFQTEKSLVIERLNIERQPYYFSPPRAISHDWNDTENSATIREIVDNVETLLKMERLKDSGISSVYVEVNTKPEYEGPAGHASVLEVDVTKKLLTFHEPMIFNNHKKKQVGALEAFKSSDTRGYDFQYNNHGLQYPFTGNCVKNSLYIAVCLAKGETPSLTGSIVFAAKIHRNRVRTLK